MPDPPEAAPAAPTAKAPDAPAAAPGAPAAPTPEPPVEQAKMVSALPAQVQQNTMDLLMEVIEKLTSLATMVGEAEIDEAATPPPEIAELLNQCGIMLVGSAEQLGAGAPPPAEAGTPPAAPEEPLDKSADAAATEKAGRKIAGANLQKLEKLMVGLAKLVSDLGGTPAEATAKAADKSMLETLQAQLDSKFAAMEKSFTSKLTQVAKSAGVARAEQAAELEEAQGLVATIAKDLREPVAGSNQHGDQTPTKKASTQWPSDMSKHVAEKKRLAREKRRAV